MLNYLSARRRGFTLPEIVLSLALLLIAWVPVVEVLVMSKVAGSLAKHRVQATYVAQRAIENLHKKAFALIVSSTSSVAIDTKGTPDNTADDLNGTQIITVTSPSTYYKKVVVEVRWNERLPGMTKSMSEYCGSFITNDPQAN